MLTSASGALEALDNHLVWKWNVNNQGEKNMKNRTFRLQKLQVWLYFMISNHIDANIVLSTGFHVMISS